MTNTEERVAVLETKVDNLDSKVDELKANVKDKHIEIKNKLEQMAENSTKQHKELGDRLLTLDNKKAWLQGLIYVLGPAIMFIATQIDWKQILK